MSLPANGGAVERLPLRAVLPGLIGIALIDLAAVSGRWPAAGWLPPAAVVAMAVLPWATLLVLRRSPSALGYTRRRALAEYGWGAVAGGLWRGASLALHLGWGALGAPPGAGALLSALVLIPLVEETFYRGYLGRALVPRLGRAGAIVAQAVLFTLHPVHWSQGLPALFSILGFGLLAGALVEWRRSLWPAWGAHGLANLIALLLAARAA